MEQILKNKVVLYIVLFLGVTNVVGLISIHKYYALAFMMIIGLIASHFTKNMIVIIAIALMSTNMIFLHKFSNTVEGFEKKKGKGKGKKGKGKGKGKKVDKDGFTQRNVPLSRPAGVGGDDFDDDELTGDRVDYASTMEQAYDNLQSVLGEGGMSNLTNETQTLISQQKNLMKTLNDMQPMMKMAKDTMSGLNLDSMTKSLQGMGSMLSSLNPTAGGN